tara:strand:- start:283 stop:480 length:198 start_codon:yes stop_codon:yes gene_type:complete
MDHKNPENLKNIVDATLATSFVSTPIWLQHVEQSLQIFMLVGGSVLLIFRLWSMFKGANDKEDDK